MRPNVINLRNRSATQSLPLGGRDALRNYASGIVLAKAGSGSDRDKVSGLPDG